MVLERPLCVVPSVYPCETHARALWVSDIAGVEVGVGICFRGQCPHSNRICVDSSVRIGIDGNV